MTSLARRNAVPGSARLQVDEEPGPRAVADGRASPAGPTSPATMVDRVLGLVPRPQREHVGPLDDPGRLEAGHDQRGVAVAPAATSMVSRSSGMAS